MANELLGQQKRRQLLQMLDQGLVMVHLDPRPDDVVVPSQFKQDPVLRLNLAYGFNLPALDVGREGVYAMLSFGGQNFGCTLPWPAIFAMTWPDGDHEGMVWPESTPVELAPFFASAGVTEGAVPVSLRPGPEGVGPASPARGSGAPRAARSRPRSGPILVVHEGGKDAVPPTVVGEVRAGESDAPANPPDEADPPPKPPTSRPVLRLVKD